MNHFKNLSFIVLVLGTFIRCTEIYTPDINTNTKALIVEGLVTDEAGPFSVKLTMAYPLPFNSVGSTSYNVKGAKVSISENAQTTYSLIETTSGIYNTPSYFKSKVGNVYKLFITTKDGSIYESSSERLLSPQTIDSIHGIQTTENYINKNNELQNVMGADVLADLYKSLSVPGPACRFVSNITIQYNFAFYERDISGNINPTYHWVLFGWDTFKLNGNENITEAKNSASNPLIENHSIGFIPFEASNYNFSAGKTIGLDVPIPSISIIYYLCVNQYTMNNDSYRFYKAANNQLSATGKIFDPIASQLYGNMKCTNDPTKIVLGLFEVSSVKQHAFLVKGSSTSPNVSVTKTTVMNMPKAKDFRYRYWDQSQDPPPTDSLSIPIPLPDWWYHN